MDSKADEVDRTTRDLPIVGLAPKDVTLEKESFLRSSNPV